MNVSFVPRRREWIDVDDSLTSWLRRYLIRFLSLMRNLEKNHKSQKNYESGSLLNRYLDPVVNAPLVGAVLLDLLSGPMLATHCR